ncbi:hypothetical protein GUITHDRAFT_149837 [Guillardia theta CCMP2712]|uniref:Uncharacterized protein n=1 Tax=Guillardia theta (strain CCMP2712) TaxID=905079 RepID=L1K2W9_GUITC|nr:hypothetical protein GUITHDRAFT_149837 [Guillardia theta CCMP2712]EKX54718.1 hypothetical protein GUITHDRAFT_149837 [Guillardia theta CCMP2712]|eukprot:XP_005841698.1 hypothetical protein GUITHDRAFT_149837 [Guillardia theta CCMP2712]
MPTNIEQEQLDKAIPCDPAILQICIPLLGSCKVALASVKATKSDSESRVCMRDDHALPLGI